MKAKKVYLALSGGVDSAVAAALFKEQGFTVRGVFMVNWTIPLSPDAPCTWKQDWKDVQAIGAHLGIPVEKINFERQYHQKVIDVFFAEYAAGRTPNPDVLCNKEIKFGLFFDLAMEQGADFVATGHYARVVASNKLPVASTKQSDNRQLATGNWLLLKGVDSTKDQSYFLWTLTQAQLRHTLFPLGEMTKAHVRQLAQKFNLPVADKPDSQGICFIGKVKLPDLLATRLKPRPGSVKTVTGEVVGEHRGIQFYTLGQRHGFGGGGSIPLYVVGKESATNTLFVAPGAEHPALFAQVLHGKNLHYIAGKAPARQWRGTAQIRYHQTDQEVTVVTRPDAQAVVVFERPQRAITPGQSVVLYAGDEVVGGGVIDEVCAAILPASAHRALDGTSNVRVG